jgi:hypothetical protein
MLRRARSARRVRLAEALHEGPQRSPLGDSLPSVEPATVGAIPLAAGRSATFGPAMQPAHMPPEQFDYIVNAISTTEPDRLKLSAFVKISAFRSEVDKLLSEAWHPKHIGIERNTPAILYRLTAASNQN